jgi:hypothetical protein
MKRLRQLIPDLAFSAIELGTEFAPLIVLLVVGGFGVCYGLFTVTTHLESGPEILRLNLS